MLVRFARSHSSPSALVSRQFVEIERARIEGLLSAFPKLVGTGGKQHTFIETATVRYVYQPMDDLYTVIITNKASNILEDLETLQLLTNIVRLILFPTVLFCYLRRHFFFFPLRYLINVAP